MRFHQNLRLGDRKKCQGTTEPVPTTRIFITYMLDRTSSNLLRFPAEPIETEPVKNCPPASESDQVWEEISSGILQWRYSAESDQLLHTRHAERRVELETLNGRAWHAPASHTRVSPLKR